MTGSTSAKIRDPIHCATYAFRREGEHLWIDTWLEYGGRLPEHFHPSLEEYWEVVAVAARVKLAAHWRDLGPARMRTLDELSDGESTCGIVVPSFRTVT
jgi:hypothetical protein